MPTRFVILHHTMERGEHWDLMLQYGTALLTWQLLREPVDHTSLPIPARRIGNHRRAYLQYEGPISGDRGYVTPVDAGSAELERITDTECLIELRGNRLSGRFRLHLLEDEWVLETYPSRGL